MSMERHEELAIERISKTCEQHDDQLYTGGCTVCLTLVCGHCMIEPSNCTDGKWCISEDVDFVIEGVKESSVNRW